MPGPFDKEVVWLGDLICGSRVRRELTVMPFEGLLILPDVQAAHNSESYSTGRSREKYHLSPELKLKFYFKIYENFVF